MSALLLKLAPYLAAAAVIFGGGWYAGGLAPKAALERLQAADWQTKAQGEEAARKAIQAELAQAQTVSANNAQVVEKLSAENAHIAADHDAALARVHRLEQLLVVASRPAAPGPGVPQAGGGSVVAGPGDPSSPSRIEGLLVDASSECERTAAQLNALISEIKPQL